MGGSNDLRSENRRERRDGGTANFEEGRNANYFLILAHASGNLAAGRRARRKSLVCKQLQPEFGTISPLPAATHRGPAFFGARLG